MTRTIAILGLTGAGKDTQVCLLHKDLGYEILKTGEMVRKAAKADPEIAKMLEDGILVDDMLVNDLVAERLNSISEDSKVVSDGYPRRIDQAIWFDQYLAEAGRRLDKVIFLSVSEAEAKSRLKKRQRADDGEKIIETRLEIFRNHTVKVLDYYKNMGKLIEINGEQSIESVNKDIIGALS